MNHTTILIAEDNPRDSDDIASAAQQTGTTVRVYSFAELMETLKGPARFDLLILDLRMNGTDPRNTVSAVKLAIDRLSLPVIVVTGYPDEELQRDCEAYGWLWVNKDSKRFKADLYHAIERSLDRGEESSDRYIALKSSREQLSAIHSMLREVVDKQQAMDGKFTELAETVEEVLTHMFGKKNRFGGRDGGGCAETCKQTKTIFDAGKAWMWAAMIGTSSVVGALVSWLVSKVTQ
jgi:CheY-like chemotaxis protein